MTTTFRKRPVEVEAVQWTGENLAEVTAFTGDADFFRTVDAATAKYSFYDPEITATVFDCLHSTWVGVKPGPVDHPRRRGRALPDRRGRPRRDVRAGKRWLTRKFSDTARCVTGSTSPSTTTVTRNFGARHFGVRGGGSFQT